MVSTNYIRRKSQSLNLVDQIFKRESAFSNPNRSPNLWTRDYIDNTLNCSSTFYYKDLYGHYGCVNSVEFSPDGNFLASGGDDKRILLWKVWDSVHDSNYEPMAMKNSHNSNIFCISFDHTQKRLFSGGNDELVIIHNIETREAIDVISHMDDVYGLSIDPFNNNVFASASNDVMIWDIRSTNAKSTQLAIGSAPFHAVMYNPCDSNILVTANSKDGIDLYDIRKPMHKLFHFYSSSIVHSQSAMCVRFNRAGNLILALRRRLSPLLYDIRSPYPLVEFESNDYYNSCTLKNCCFMGEDDQFVASGSDNFQIYIWRIPDQIFNDSSTENPLKTNCIQHVSQATQVLSGHRSIVNQIRFNDKNGLIASTGIEKIIKLWSPVVKFDESNKVNSKESSVSPRRNVYSYHDYLDLIHNDRFYVPHDYSSNNISEDTRMIAYFDSMIERDITSNWMSSSGDDSPSYFNYVLNTELSYEDHVALDSDNDSLEVAFHEVSTDSDEKFSIQKRFDFTQSLETKKFGNEDHLTYVFAKRMHARYITSFVNNLICQVEKIHNDKSDPKEQSNQKNENTSPQKKTKQINQNASSSSSSNTEHQTNSQVSIDSSNLNKKIKSKKENSLMFFAYKFSKSLLFSLYFGTLYEKSKNKYFEDHFDESNLPVNSKQEIQAQIKKMSKLKAKKICDKRLHGLLNTLHKKVTHLNNLLNDSHDIKTKCEDFIRNSKCRFRAHLFMSNITDSDDESDFEIEEEIDDVHMNDSEEGENTDVSSLASSISMSSSDSSSSDDNSDKEEMKSEPIVENENKNENEGNKSNCDVSNPVSQVAQAASSTNADLSTPSTTQGTSKGIYFKKINRKNKNFKQRSNKRHRKVCKNKRQRKS